MKPNQNLGKKHGIISRACSRCGGDLGDKYKKDRYCKQCHAEANRESRARIKKRTEDLLAENNRLKEELGKLKQQQNGRPETPP